MEVHEAEKPWDVADVVRSQVLPEDAMTDAEAILVAVVLVYLVHWSKYGRENDPE